MTITMSILAQNNSFFVFDTNNNIGLSIYNIDTGLGYRGRIFSYEELRSLI